MTAVLTYWQLQEDENRFVEYLASTGEIAAWIDDWVEDISMLRVARLSELIVDENAQAILFCREDFLRRTPGHSATIDGRTLFQRGSLISDNVLSYRRGSVKPTNELTQSNLCGYWDRPSANGMQLERKEMEFIKWGQQILRWTRRIAGHQQLLNGFEYPATHAAKRAFDSGDLIPALY